MSAGVLALVGTPIGNLGDLSPRARDELDAAALICCEDTRRTGKLLELSGIGRRPLLRVDDHVEAAAITTVLDHLGRGERVVLVSDAGMPAIADPGERLVAAVAGAGFEVVVVPGPSAGLAALVASGLPTARFVFEGFVPRKGNERAARLGELAAERRTMVLYEAPHRVQRTVRDLADALGPDRRVALARELTKLHEQVWRGTLGEAVAHTDGVEPRGEYVIVVEGAPPPTEATDDELRVALRAQLDAGATTRDAVAAVGTRFGAAHRHVYALATELRSGT
jgi:16S rRNA (cytidine1402-2'-O)-methyltransferase